MVTESFLKYLFCDKESLNSYYCLHKQVDINDLKRSLMLIERSRNVYIPDHYYRLGQEKTFNGLRTLGDVLSNGMYHLAEEYLEWKDSEGKVYTKAEKQNEWQLLISYIPPLYMQALMIWKHAPWCENINLIDYIHDVLSKNIVYTAMPNPYILPLKQIVKDNEGLCDLHIHLNGTLETDIIWQDYLVDPDKAYADLKKAYCNGKVIEQYSQQTPFFSPESFRELLYIARYLRRYIFCYIFNVNNNDIIQSCSFEQLLVNIHEGKMALHYNDPIHPIRILFGISCSLLHAECLFYIRIFQYLEKHADEVLANLFHYYLLILGHINNMLVQQPNCNGFEEFQKYTLNEFRGFSEKYYTRRFHQLAGNELDNVKVLEGRFSPKKTIIDENHLLTRIRKGWEKFNKDQKNLNKPESELLLVAHFIKTPDTHPDEFIRFKKKRQDLYERAKVLAMLLHSKNENSKLVRSIDAASSEFDTPPEVFSTCYKYLRQTGYKHFTFHAGEDFFHILSGLRAIFEAVIFLDLRRTDRIGHATACGVAVEVWLNNIGTEMLIRKGEYLDDLLFAYYFIDQYGDADLKSCIPSISRKVEDLCTEIYGEYYPMSLQIQAWLMRGEDPNSLLDKDLSGAFKGRLMCKEKLFLSYHTNFVAKKYDEIIVIKTEDVFDRHQLTKLQLLILKFLHDREIVIETLPTSNVAIGHHHGFETYHLYNWYKWRKEGHAIPPIVVGTDDAGIFATNIYNEYCNIYC